MQPPVTEFVDRTFRYTQLERQEDLAIFVQTHKVGQIPRYEVVQIGPPGATDRFFTVRRNSGRISSCLPYRTAFKNKKIRETALERVGIRWDIS